MNSAEANKGFHLAFCVTIILLAACVSSCGGSSQSSMMNPPPPPGQIAFALPVSMSSGGVGAGSVALADFNGDGKLDIAVSNFTSNTIAVFLNNGDGTFAAPIISTFQITALGFGAIATGDFNQDGKADLLLGTIAGQQADIVLLGNGDGTFRQLPPLPNSYGFFRARIEDLNGDGHQDIVTGDNGNIAVYLGAGDGTFTQAPLPDLTFSGAFMGIVVGDFNGDGKLDILAANLLSQPGAQSTLVFFAGNGDGSFQAPTIANLPYASPTSLASADFMNSGKLDAAIGFPGGALIAPGNGNGTFQENSMISVYSSGVNDPNNALILQAADFNLDGKPDVVVGDYATGNVSLLLNGGIGQNPPPSGTQFQFSIQPGISDIAVGDLNGDGLPDIVVCNGETNQITVILSVK